MLFTTKVHSLNVLVHRLICQISVLRWSISEEIPESNLASFTGINEGVLFHTASGNHKLKLSTKMDAIYSSLFQQTNHSTLLKLQSG